MSSDARTAILDDLGARGLVQDSTDLADLRSRLAERPITLYHGIDPSAPSLHIGNFVGVLALRRFQDAGHDPIVLVGGATGMIGDPGGRSEERNLLDEDTLAHNIAGIRGQLEALVDLERATLVSNYDWTKDVGVLDFLRDVGKHATVNQMVARESVRSRMDSEHGISYTEFSYMLLQAYDFWWLHEHMGCELQIGGSDQWGNLAQGVDLIRRRSGAQVHALTWPLITRSDGQKFGKSVSGAVWLDESMTSSFELYQYFLNTDDGDVLRFLQQLTLLPIEEIDAIVEAHAADPGARQAQRRLARELVGLIHGDDAVRTAEYASALLFGDVASVPGLDPATLEYLRSVAPSSDVARSVLETDEPLVDLLLTCGLATSRRDARQALSDGAVRWNGHKLPDHRPNWGQEAVGVLQKGKKSRHLVVFV